MAGGLRPANFGGGVRLAPGAVGSGIPNGQVANDVSASGAPTSARAQQSPSAVNAPLAPFMTPASVDWSAYGIPSDSRDSHLVFPNHAHVQQNVSAWNSRPQHFSAPALAVEQWNKDSRALASPDDEQKTLRSYDVAPLSSAPPETLGRHSSSNLAPGSDSSGVKRTSEASLPPLYRPISARSLQRVALENYSAAAPPLSKTNTQNMLNEREHFAHLRQSTPGPRAGSAIVSHPEAAMEAASAASVQLGAVLGQVVSDAAFKAVEKAMSMRFSVGCNPVPGLNMSSSDTALGSALTPTSQESLLERGPRSPSGSVGHGDTITQQQQQIDMLVSRMDALAVENDRLKVLVEQQAVEMSNTGKRNTLLEETLLALERRMDQEQKKEMSASGAIREPFRKNEHCPDEMLGLREQVEELQSRWKESSSAAVRISALEKSLREVVELKTELPTLQAQVEEVLLSRNSRMGAGGCSLANHLTPNENAAGDAEAKVSSDNSHSSDADEKERDAQKEETSSVRVEIDDCMKQVAGLQSSLKQLQAKTKQWNARSDSRLEQIEENAAMRESALERIQQQLVDLSRLKKLIEQNIRLHSSTEEIVKGQASMITKHVCVAMREFTARKITENNQLVDATLRARCSEYARNKDVRCVLVREHPALATTSSASTSEHVAAPTNTKSEIDASSHPPAPNLPSTPSAERHSAATAAQ
eukprot:CAMPEP_0185849682 /NCGR_PEP_ID=MMETSP1354-20130828/4107_1 /TAXON_ID=708628 /ORGANISM="Erythrolobus madagascarensis, Strain CCMP3276" /LENGTH=701 /DNA_ID=CAMNT_0028550263 /DNA_START=43 /DNA_END=2148 /DNA_ORIENTATION=-